MRERHEALRKIYSLILSGEESIQSLFDFSKTVHADLDLSWIRPDFQEKHIGPVEKYQIVIATVNPEQTSDAHLHEVGASSFVVLGPKVGVFAPSNLTFRTGELLFPSGDIKMKSEVLCHEELEIDIPSYQVHQFENKGDKPAQVLIVTHPIISVEEGKEDIHLAF